ncbi:hypothetical protein ACE1ET_10210 [Saccharicrinis sp. FJH62]|uniref:hypothetical protein n=1 Tax=Saccharicrinis sp. FJH62 TaxID=3344657 RepID=UPI0035D48A4F
MNTERTKITGILIITFMILVTGAGNIWAQKFSHPKYKAKNAEYVELSGVEITNEYTIVTISALHHSSWALHVSPKTYIINSLGGERLYVQKAEGVYILYKKVQPSGISIVDSLGRIEINKSYYDLGINFKSVKLYFPKIDKEVQNIDYRSGKDGNFWHFFEINVASDIGVDKSVKSGKKGKDGNCQYIDNPGYTAKSGNFNITKIELCDTATILHFQVQIPKESWIYIPSKSCIRDSEGGENLFVTSAEGTNIDERILSDEAKDGQIFYKLFFPPIKKSVKKIDFREINEGGSWFVFELDSSF